MSEGLKALKAWKEVFLKTQNITYGHVILYNMLNIIEKELKALEIVRKYVAIDELKNDGEFFMYSIRDKQYVSSRSCKVMTKEEYDLLKEVGL